MGRDPNADGPRATRPIDPRNWPLFYHTARNMQYAQLAGVAERKARHAVIPRIPIDFDARYERRIPQTLRIDRSAIRQNLEHVRSALSDPERRRLRDGARRATRGVLTYMNTPLDIATGADLDWEDPRLNEIPVFWRLKLQGLDFLRLAYLGYSSPSACPTGLIDRLNRWLRDWDEKTEIGTSNYLRRNWIPHSVSLRLINLSRYLAWHDGLATETRERVARIAFKNGLFLANHVEYDVGGNHLIENAGGLILAGTLFDGHDVGWLAEGRSILESTTDQFLADGGHFERSPMYHIQCLTRYLTAHDLAAAKGLERSAPIERTVSQATAYLRSLRPPDSRTPLLNDAVFDETLSLDSCLAYAEAAGVEAPAEEARTRTGSSDLDESGYFWLGTDENVLLVDGGEVGPPHIPAHSHNDLLSYLLWIDGEQIVTDTGTYEYAPTARRHHSRSAAAHNTVQVDESEPIDIGGQYFMGRRVSPDVRSYADGGIAVFEGKYRKAGLFAASYTCRRRLLHRDPWWLCYDRVAADSRSNVRSRIHFHPEVRLAERDGGLVATKRDSAATLWLYLLNGSNLRLTESPYFPRFGEVVDRPAATVKSTGRDVTLAYLLTREPLSDVGLEASGDRTTLRVDGDRLPLPETRV